ncbi:MAG: ATP-binding protein [Anaerolineae bacterium]|nr:ATP-binding protein [Anaerolineae bacterium]MDQ7036272.1 ATP-binding protein [Anaerolineae bacterium]
MDKTNPSSTIDTEIIGLRAIKAFNEHVATILDDKIRPYEKLCSTIADIINTSRVVIFSADNENAILDYVGSYPAKRFPADEQPAINIFNPESDSLFASVLEGHSVAYDPSTADSSLGVLTTLLTETSVIQMLTHHEEHIGLIAVSSSEDGLSNTQKYQFEALLPSITSTLYYIQNLVAMRIKVTDVEREAEIFRQIDDELSDVIKLEYVFTMIMDWALRFTNADAAGLTLYDGELNSLRIIAHYGYREGAMPIGERLQPHQHGITYRVATIGQAEIVPDIREDKDYHSVADGILTQMTVPILRDQKVIAVLSLESRKLNGFSDDHLAFVRKLTGRAGVAVDNARLFEETRREREKLSHILRTITNMVIVVGSDNHIVLMNDAARLAFQLALEQDYEGQLFSEVVLLSQLQDLYRETLESGEEVTGEVELPNNRMYFTNISRHVGIGHIIVMQDITYFKETDRLKTELVATVSHDLKQPLSVMRGYLDLLRMVNTFDERSQNYVNSLEYAFGNMRQLIDDLLDIANIEAGLQLSMEDVSLSDVLRRCMKNNEQNAGAKSLAVSLRLPPQLPKITGDPSRLEQIFNNLINNAIKYTQPEGWVKIRTEVKQTILRIQIQDNGMGIGPEDQAQIFERFYRVRRPETDSIDGTGLGLAIVKSLVESHNGKIDLKSDLGEGSTFRVTLPLI